MMSFAYIQKARYIFDIYWVAFIFGSSLYGLLIDIKQCKEKGTSKDAKLAKRIYISLMTLSASIYIITKFL